MTEQQFIEVSSPLSGLHFSIISPHDCIRCAFTFPSPVGELHFSMQLKRSLMIIWVSVPCRGTTFLNQYLWILTELPVEEFPSCRGTTFLNQSQLLLNNNHNSFRPVGELHFSIPSAIPPPVWAHGRDCVGKIFLEK